MRGLSALLAAFALATSAAVGGGNSGSPAANSAVTFRDVTQQSGVRFVHNSGAFGKKFLPETLGPGVAFIDYDNDGWPDVFLVNGMDWPGHAQKHTTPKLYHNNHDGTFTDVTHKAGLDMEMYGMGVAVGDYDNDGFDDLFITALGQSRLFHNNGNGTFTDVTQKAGLSGPRELSTSAAWVDYDKDGRLDLVVGNYVQWTQETDLYCTLDGKSKSYCTPESYKGTAPRLWHNRGDGTFEDVTKKAGLAEPTSKTMGIAVLDYDNDGWPDLLLSNDTQPNKLYRNNGNGTFSEKGVIAGVAFSEDGVARAGMGVDAADYDHSGYHSVMITNFSNQMLSLYHNEGKGLFVDEAPQSAIGRATLLTLGFGCFFFDYDLDGWPDIFVANGHIDPEIQRVQANVKYAMPYHGRFIYHAARWTRCGLCRHQQRWPSGLAALHQWRPGIFISQRSTRRCSESQRAAEACRNKIKQGRDRRSCATLFRRRPADPNAAQRLQLPFFQRTHSDFRFGAAR